MYSFISFNYTNNFEYKFEKTACSQNNKNWYLNQNYKPYCLHYIIFCSCVYDDHNLILIRYNR